jgi:AraC-like DNA-binding protein
MMPVMDGLAFARALRADPATDFIPVILLTARSGTGDEVAGLATGADDYVTKPFTPEVLRSRVRNLIALRHRLRERLREGGGPAPEAAGGRAEPPFTARVRAIVLAHLADEAFTVEALAAEVALSYSQLHRRLTAESGVAPQEFVRRVRLEAAARLLADGAGSVSEVAYAVGFVSLAHFSRAFRAQFGASPSAYAQAGR